MPSKNGYAFLSSGRSFVENGRPSVKLLIGGSAKTATLVQATAKIRILFMIFLSLYRHNESQIRGVPLFLETPTSPIPPHFIKKAALRGLACEKPLGFVDCAA
jgi:hypothetical protein